uniref:Fibronectin type-III domain-containing protein n=1 Tax=Echeneis naucrates TaxID=173247 RepID=A0A665UWD8_ECHNA
SLGVDNLQCVNDYLSTINCTLRITQTANSSDTNSSYWLIFTAQSTFIAVYLCLNFPSMSDFCLHCVFSSVKPNTPCCLTVSHNSSQHNFTWKSTYEEYAEFTNLVDNFKFQLHFFKRGDKHNSDKEVMSRDIYIDQTNYSVDDPIFAPDTEYIARVRSSPNLAFYKGQWSDWSPEVHWKTESAMSGESPTLYTANLNLFELIALLLLISSPVFDFIPTPAPYFHTLYSECQGDFRSWVITHENTADMQKEESSLQIETLTKYADVLEEDHQPRFNQQLVLCSPYSNMIDRVHDTSLPGVPYAVSTMASHSAPENSDSPWYCNEYCTLSTFQQTSPVTADNSLCF